MEQQTTTPTTTTTTPAAPRLHIGDPVEWRGSWGAAAPAIAVVTEIEHTSRSGDKYGKAVESLDWPTVMSGRAVVTLANGAWAYGYQLRPAPGMAAAVALANFEQRQAVAGELAAMAPLDPRD